MRSIHGAPDARIVNTAPGEPERVSTSESIDVSMLPTGGVESVIQQGNVVYNDGERHARAERARYTPADQWLSLTGSPAITDKGLITTARTLRLNRTTGDASAEGNVKSTYSDLHEQPTGALLAAASPIHVTAQNMTAHRTSTTAMRTRRPAARNSRFLRRSPPRAPAATQPIHHDNLRGSGYYGTLQ